MSGFLGLVRPGIGLDIFVTKLLGPAQRTPLLKIASGGVNRRHIELGSTANEVLLDAGTVTGCKELLLIDE